MNTMNGLAEGDSGSSENVRSGRHPLDDELAETGLLAWFVPAFHLLVAHFARIAPFAAALGLYVWLYPKLMLGGPLQESGFRSFIDSAHLYVVPMALTIAAYIHFVRAEGSAYGVGAIPELVSIVQRVAVLLAFWVVLGWLLSQLLEALISTGPVLRLIFRMYLAMGFWAFTVPLWLVSPLLVMYWTIQTLTHIRAIRGDEPVLEILIDSFQRVWSQSGRLLLPVWLIAGVLILVGHLFGQVLIEGLTWMMIRLGWASVAALAMAGFAFAVPFWFVIERVYCPHLGVEHDIETDATSGQSGPALVPEDWPAEIAAIERSDGPAAAARRLVDGLRERQLDGSGYAAALTGLSNRAALAEELAKLAVARLSNGRSGELAWIVGQGIRADPQFLMNRPGVVLSISRRLAMQQQPGLACLLLQRFLARHPGHEDHLGAGLQLARVLATQRDDVDAARKVLAQLQLRYPDQAEIAQLLRQFA